MEKKYLSYIDFYQNSFYTFVVLHKTITVLEIFTK